MGSFESDFGFTLRGRKSHTFDQLQLDGLEIEENFISAMKSRGKDKPTEKKRGKEETSFYVQDKESPYLKWVEMDKLIKSLSHNVVKLELENKSLLKQNAQGHNRGYNP